MFSVSSAVASAVASVDALPYFTIPNLELGPVTLQAFGILVATGVVVGTTYFFRPAAMRRGATFDQAQSLMMHTLVYGFVISHVFDIVAYRPEAILEDPLILVKIWAGISSMGGFIGAAVGMWMWKRKYRNHTTIDAGYWGDAVILGLWVGWCFGRAGCTVVHDHPGSQSDFFLAIEMLDGVQRHDLGFYELLYTIPWAIFFSVTEWRDKKAGRVKPPWWFSSWAAIVYAPTRFFFDFLRARDTDLPDPRYLGLTPAQWVAVGLLVLGVLGLRASARKRRAGVQPGMPRDIDDEQVILMGPDGAPLPEARTAAPKPRTSNSGKGKGKAKPKAKSKRAKG